MADLTPEQQNLLDQLEMLTEAAERAGIQVDKFGRSSVKNIDASFKNLEKQVKKAGGSYKDSIGSLESLKEAIEEMDEAAVKSGAQQKALDKLEAVAAKARQQILTDSIMQIGGVLIKGYAGYFINQAKTTVSGLMGDSSPFKLAADLQIAALDDMNKGVHGVTGAVSGGATALAALAAITGVASGGVSLLATGLVVAGASMLNFATDTYTDIEKFRIGTLGNALDSTVKSFKEASNAGAMFSGGLTELRATALQSGLTQEQYTKVIADQRDKLAQAGFGVTEGAKLISRVTERFSKTVGTSGKLLQQEMLNLGYSIEEQVSLAADVAAQIKRMGGNVTDSAVEQATAEYAKNLRLIAEVTGDDAKKRMDQAAKITEEYAFQRKFLKQHNNDVGALIAVQGALAKASDTQRKAIQQAYVTGTVTDIPAIMTGQRETGLRIAQQLNQSRINAAELDNTISAANTAFLNNNDPRLAAISGANMLGFGENADVAAASTDMLNNALRNNTDSLNRSRIAVNGAAATTDEFQAGINAGVKELQNMKNTLQNDVTKALKDFANEVPKILLDARKKLVEAGILSGLPGSTPAEKKDAQRKLNEEKNIKNTGYPDDGSADMAEEARRRLRGPTAPGLEKGGIVTGKPISPGFAEGGIATGSLSGYQAMLHGTEAVVPLPDNRSIPVTLDSSSLTMAVNQNSSILNAILDKMVENNTISSQIVSNTA
jgi:hypothetical protein